MKKTLRQCFVSSNVGLKNEDKLNLVKHTRGEAGLRFYTTSVTNMFIAPPNFVLSHVELVLRSDNTNIHGEVCTLATHVALISD